MHQSPSGRPWLLFGLLAGSLGLNLYMVTHRQPPARPPAVTAASPSPMPQAAPIPATVPQRQMRPQRIPVEVISPAPVDHGAPLEPDRGDWQLLDVEVEHSLARTFSNAMDEKGPALSAIFARLFHWDIDLRRDLRKGDRIVALWRETPDGYEFGAAALESGKLGRTLSTYAYRRKGDTYISHWNTEGVEVSRRLKQTPLAEYQQVTALLRDRPSHSGMDFKTPTGTPVLATQAGTVTRVNWNTRANGRCVELRFSDGTLAKYLHLEETSVRAGQRMIAGSSLGLSGNTGHSTAPHLHYQLNQGQRVVDPVTYHGTLQRSLRPGDRDDFKSHVARLDALLGRALARR